MFVKILLIAFLVQAAVVFGNQPQKFMLKNKATGKVLDAVTDHISSGYWANKNSQLWTLEGSHKSGYYYVHNVGNGKVLDACPRTRAVLTWPKHGGTNQMWKMDTVSAETTLEVLYFPKDNMMQSSDQPELTTSTPSDDNHKWLLVEP